jgi:hypothetical protein
VANASYISIEDFQYLLWRPLYWFGNKGQPGYNAALSLANAPVYSNGGKTVTITLKHNIHWSDCKLLTNRDVELWMNMLIANRTDYFNYSPGYIPDNLVSESYPASTRLQDHSVGVHQAGHRLLHRLGPARLAGALRPQLRVRRGLVADLPNGHLHRLDGGRLQLHRRRAAGCARGTPAAAIAPRG